MDGDRLPPEGRVQHWERVARAHPEFFRVSGKSVSISLVARFVARKEQAERQFPPEAVHKLMESAIDLHDRQFRRSQQWTLYLPLWVAGLAGVGSVFATVVGLVTHR